MFGTGGAHSGNCVGTRGRFRLAGLALAAAALVALAPPSAYASATVVHSAERGKLAGGRLTLYGVGRNVTVTTNSARSRVVRVKTMHRRLFSPRTPATGTLHVAGHHGGDELTFRLSRPRYNAARRTISYRAKPLNRKPLASAAATVRRFDAASLTIVPHPAVMGGDRGGNDCEMNVANLTDGFPDRTARGNPIQLVSSQKWDTDDWAPAPPTSIVFYDGGADFTSEGDLWRGCAQSTVWQFVPACIVGDGCGPTGTFTFNVEWDWGKNAPTYSCTSSNPQFKCLDMTAGVINWWLVPA